MSRAPLPPLPPLLLATAADLARLPHGSSAEVIHGSLSERAAPNADHGIVQAEVAGWTVPVFARRPGGGRPGGWWILVDTEVELAEHEIVRPDLSGWRRERSPERPRGRPVRLRPDWVCEILSPGNRRRDLFEKMAIYREAGVPHYWIVDPEEQLLTVYRLEPAGYLVALNAGATDRVRAEPFDAVELPVGLLFGEEPEEEPEAGATEPTEEG